MSRSYQIDQGKNLIRVKYSGEISVGQTIAFVDELLDDPNYKKDMNSISDLTDGIFDWSLSDIDRFRRYVISIEEKAGRCKWALISQRGVTERNARIFIALNDLDAKLIEAKLFDNLEDAERWAMAPSSE